MHLPGDVQTAPDHPLGDFPRYKWQHMMSFVPQDLHGCHALDIECPRNLTTRDRDRMLTSAWPKMAFIEHSLEGDPTNWWVPNQAAIEAMLRSCGWQSMQYFGEEIYVCWDRRVGLPLGARSNLLKSPNP